MSEPAASLIVDVSDDSAQTAQRLVRGQPKRVQAAILRALGYECMPWGWVPVERDRVKS